MECDAKITLPPDVIKGEILGCKECSSSFEVADIEKGVSIKPAEIPGEDWGE
ncbi:MAG: lysine biosynthesis protein LysW [Candidatus Micrarchaeota archaeon]|nr:lysine biosynthesis protein LysW [Candidatus Micrarchaeota archaeon]